MRNWSVDMVNFDKNSKEYIKWKLEQLINYGLQKEKLDKQQLQTFLPMLNLDPSKRRFIEFILKDGFAN